jgi:Nickel responsive protein SCO4226-like
MTGNESTEYVAECFWPGVQETDLGQLDERIASAAAELVRAGESVSYLGSMLMRADEVVFCLFEGGEQAVRTAAERAQVPFERILETVRSPLSRAGNT